MDILATQCWWDRPLLEYHFWNFQCQDNCPLQHCEAYLIQRTTIDCCLNYHNQQVSHQQLRVLPIQHPNIVVCWLQQVDLGQKNQQLEHHSLECADNCHFSTVQKYLSSPPQKRHHDSSNQHDQHQCFSLHRWHVLNTYWQNLELQQQQRDHHRHHQWNEPNQFQLVDYHRCQKIPIQEHHHLIDRERPHCDHDFFVIGLYHQLE